MRDRCFPQVLRDARRIGDQYPGLSPRSPESMDRLGVSLAHLDSACTNFYDAAEVERVFYPEIEKLLFDFFPGATDALRSEEHTSALQSLMRISYAVFCLKKKKTKLQRIKQ